MSPKELLYKMQSLNNGDCIELTFPDKKLLQSFKSRFFHYKKALGIEDAIFLSKRKLTLRFSKGEKSPRLASYDEVTVHVIKKAEMPEKIEALDKEKMLDEVTRKHQEQVRQIINQNLPSEETKLLLQEAMNNANSLKEKIRKEN